LEVRREGERGMFAAALFSMPVASSELLELAMMVWKWDRWSGFNASKASPFDLMYNQAAFANRSQRNRVLCSGVVS